MSRFKDLAEAIEDAKENGYPNLFEVEKDGLTTKGTEEYFTEEQLTIVSSVHFDRGTNPGDDRSLFLIETDTGLKGYLPTSYTTYRKREKAEFLDNLINPR